MLGWVLRTALWLLLGGWLGAWGLFGLVIAPTAFQVLPSQAAAGALVAPVLSALHNYGIVAGIGLALLGVLLRRRPLLVALPACLALLCAISEYRVTRAIEQVAPRSFGEQQDPEAAVRFSELHQTSRLLYGCVGLGVLALVGLQVLADSESPSRSPRARRSGPPQPSP